MQLLELKVHGSKLVMKYIKWQPHQPTTQQEVKYW